MNQYVSIKECFSEAWNLFKKYFWILIGGSLLGMILTVVILLIPFINLLSIISIPIFTAGIMLLFLNTGKDANPRISDLFQGFKRFGTIMGSYWLFVIFFTVLLSPGIIYLILIAKKVSIAHWDFYRSFVFWRIYLFFFINTVIAAFILIRYVFIFFVMVDEPKRGVIDIFKTSSKIVKGHGKDLIIYIIVWKIFEFLGTILFYIPGFIISIVGTVGFARYYLKLKEMKLKPQTIVIKE